MATVTIGLVQLPSTSRRLDAEVDRSLHRRGRDRRPRDRPSRDGDDDDPGSHAADRPVPGFGFERQYGLSGSSSSATAPDPQLRRSRAAGRTMTTSRLAAAQATAARAHPRGDDRRRAVPHAHGVARRGPGAVQTRPQPERERPVARTTADPDRDRHRRRRRARRHRRLDRGPPGHAAPRAPDRRGRGGRRRPVGSTWPCPSTAPTRPAGSAWPSTRCSPPSRRRRTISTGWCRTRATSCARRSPACAPTSTCWVDTSSIRWPSRRSSTISRARPGS